MPTKHGFTEKCYGCKYLSLCGHGYACTNENYCNNADNMDELSLELKESEDERIRNWLIAQLELKSDVNNPHDLELMILKSMAWLEKQNSNVDNANKEYWRGYREGKQEILDKYAELEKQGEQKTKSTDAFIEKACVKLKKLMYDNLMFQGRLHRNEVIDNFVVNFKKYLVE